MKTIQTREQNLYKLGVLFVDLTKSSWEGNQTLCTNPTLNGSLIELSVLVCPTPSEVLVFNCPTRIFTHTFDTKEEFNEQLTVAKLEGNNWKRGYDEAMLQMETMSG